MAFELAIGARFIMGDAEVADALFVLPLPKRREMRAPVDEVVDLHQVEARDAQKLHGLAHLGDAGLSPADPDLGGDERLLARRLHLREEIADDAFGRAIHRRGIDDRAAAFEERVQDAGERRSFLDALPDVEALPGSQADDGQFLPGRRDLAALHLVLPQELVPSTVRSRVRS